MNFVGAWEMKQGDKMKMYRHGDVQIIPVDEIPAGAKKLARKELAYGEKTGHAHRIDIGELFQTQEGKLYLKVEKLTKVSHEEHKKSEIPAGNYLIGIKRQAVGEAWAEVAD